MAEKIQLRIINAYLVFYSIDIIFAKYMWQEFYDIKDEELSKYVWLYVSIILAAVVNISFLAFISWVLHGKKKKCRMCKICACKKDQGTIDFWQKIIDQLFDPTGLLYPFVMLILLLVTNIGVFKES